MGERRITGLIDAEVGRFLELARELGYSAQMAKTGGLTPDQAARLLKRFTAQFGPPTGWSIPPAWRTQRDDLTDVGALVVAGAMRALGVIGEEARFFRMEIKQTLAIRQTLSLIAQSPFRRERYERLYEQSRRLHYVNKELGLNFEVAVVSRADLPELIELGSPGIMIFDRAFIVEDFFLDLDDESREKFMTLIAVHEYGERIFMDHHKASMLEFAVAEHMGILPRYLEFLKGRLLVKFRDVVLHRMKSDFKKQLKEKGIKVENAAFDRPEISCEDPSAIAAREIASRFRMPKDLREKYEGADIENVGIAKGKLEKWIDYVTALEQIEAFYNKAVDDAGEAAFQASREPGADAKTIGLKIRMALFRVLGIMKSEIDSGVLAVEYLGDEMQATLFARFMEDLRNIVGDKSRAQSAAKDLLSDPLFSMDAGQMLELAAADHAIPETLGLNLVLELENGFKKDKTAVAEQQLIETARLRGWQVAMNAGLEAEDQLAALGAYEKTARKYNDLMARLEPEFARYTDPQRVYDGYFTGHEGKSAEEIADWQHAELLEYVSALVEWAGFGPDEKDVAADMVQPKIDELMPLIWKRAASLNSLRKSPYERVKDRLRIDVKDMMERMEASGLRCFFSEEILLGRKLADILDAGDNVGRESLHRITYNVWEEISSRRQMVSVFIDHYASWLARLANAGFVPKPLVKELTALAIERMPAYSSNMMRNIGSLPFLADTVSSVKEIIDLVRTLFTESIRALGPQARPVMEAMAESDGVWKRLEASWAEEIRTIFRFVRRYRVLVPNLAASLSGQGTTALWKKLDLRGYVRQMIEQGIPPQDKNVRSRLDALETLHTLGYYFIPQTMNRYTKQELMRELIGHWDFEFRNGSVRSLDDLNVEEIRSRIREKILENESHNRGVKLHLNIKAYELWQTVVRYVAAHLHVNLREVEARIPRVRFYESDNGGGSSSPQTPPATPPGTPPVPSASRGGAAASAVESAVSEMPAGYDVATTADAAEISYAGLQQTTAGYTILTNIPAQAPVIGAGVAWSASIGTFMPTVMLPVMIM